MDAPRILLNAKTYSQALGARGALGLARACQEAAEEAGTVIGLAPPMVELAYLARQDGLDRVRLYAQHSDAREAGASTGWTPAEAVQAAGAAGSLLNHAEHKVPHSDVAAAARRLAALGLETCLCADSMDEVDALAPLQPTYLAVEPPELIGGDVSVTRADAAIVRDAAAAVRRHSPHTLPLCGAGVKDGRDVQAALELGAHGVLLASGVVKHQDPLAALRGLCSGLD